MRAPHFFSGVPRSLLLLLVIGFIPGSEGYLQCSTATSITCGASNVVLNTAGGTVAANTTSVCVGLPNVAPQAWATFTLATTATVTVSVAAPYGQLVLYGSPCSDPACVTGTNFNTSASQSGTLAAGTYYMMVSSGDSTSSTFTVGLVCAAQSYQTCNLAKSLPLQKVTSDTFTTAGGNVVAAATCGGVANSGAPQAWATFTLDTLTNVIVSLASTTANGLLTIYSGTCGSLTCVAGHTVGLTTAGSPYAMNLTLAAATYYIVMQASSGTGSFDLTFETSGECIDGVAVACKDPNGISFDLSEVLMSPTTYPTCNGVVHDSPQLWFAVTVTTQTNVTVKVLTSTTSTDTKVTIFSGNCNSLSCVTAVSATTNSNSYTSVLSVDLNAGTYYGMLHGVVEDPTASATATTTASGSQGSLPGVVTIQLSCAPLISPNPSCIDKPGWTDRNNYTCSDYTTYGWCSDWWYGSGWSHSWGPFGTYEQTSSVGADLACCNCGAARAPTKTTNCNATAWGQWSVCTSSGETTCEQTRTRTVITMPDGGTGCGPLSQSQSCTGCPQCATTAWGSWSCIAQGYNARLRHVTKKTLQPQCPPLGQVGRTSACTSPSLHFGNVLQIVGNNDNGQLAMGDSLSRVTLGIGVTAPDTLPIQSVFLGGYHTAVFAGPLVYMCGLNSDGQLGLGDNIERDALTLLPGPNNDDIATVALGGYHSSIIANGAVYLFGQNGNGQLGSDTYATSYVPQAPASAHTNTNRSVAVSNLNVTSIQLGGFFSILLTGGGQVYTFGDGSYGQLGYVTAAQLDTLVISSTVTQLFPMQVTFPSGAAVKIIAAGEFHAAFYTTTGALYMAGANYFLGLCVTGIQFSAEYLESEFYSSFEPTLNQTSPLVRVSSQLPITAIALGTYHSVFLFSNGTVHTCGRNTGGGEVGPNDAVGITHFAITNGTADASTNITKIVAGTSYTIVMAEDGTVYGAGSNTYGQLGLGSVLEVSEPTMLTTTVYGGIVVDIAGGYTHSASVREATNTPTPTPTTSLTPTVTTTGTGTPQPTLTPSFAICGLPSMALSSGGSTWTLTSKATCTQVLDLGVGSTSWTSRTVGVRIASLPAPLTLGLLTGCTTTGSGCQFTFPASTSVGKDQRLPISSVTAASMEVIYGSQAASSRELEAMAVSSPSVQFYTAYSASGLMLGLTCALTAVLAALLVAGIWLWYQLWRTRKNAKTWRQRPRYSNPWFQLIFSLGGWAIITGVAWVIIVACTSSPTIQPIALLAAGAALAGVGFAVCFVGLLWAERDPEHYICVACDKPVSKWHFRGTYLPSGDGFKKKAHTEHIKCVMCGKKVITDCWPECPKHRRCHSACWDAHVERALANPAYVREWVSKQGGHATETELAHLLAAAVKKSAEPTVVALMEVAPNLPSAPVSQYDMRTCMHIAARDGNMPILLLLLQSKPDCLDPVCPIDPFTMPSLYLKGTIEEATDDVYILQPFLTVNDRPLYVGHAHGKYLFFYDPETDQKSKIRHSAGWCLSPYLGTGSSSYRLPLPDPEETRRRKLDQANAQTKSRSRVGRLAERLYGPEQTRKMTRRLSRAKDTEDDSEEKHDFPSVPGNFNKRTKVRVARASAQEPTKVGEKSGEKDGKEPEGAKVPEVVAAEIVEVEVEWLGSTISLLQDAISSGHHETIQHVTQLYKAQDPGCQKWSHFSGHGLWDVYPPSAQAEIRKALEDQVPAVTLETYQTRDGEAVTVDLGEMLHRTAKGLSKPIRSTMQAAFQHRESQDVPYRITSNIDSILHWNNAVVVFTPGHLAMACPDELTLGLVVEEGVTDYALWSPPCKVGTRDPQISNEQLSSMFNTIFHKEVGQVMGMGDQRFTIHTAATGLRRAAIATEGQSSTGIGSRLTDGLDNRQTDKTVSFYPTGYTSDKGCLPFCAELPDNKVGYTFKLQPIIKMAADSLMKLMEMQRQGYTWKARDIIAAYVYSYELTYDDGDNGGQIYGEMNKAMRLKHETNIEFWRPLIWEIDVALASFPPYAGKAYRGINCTIKPEEYQVGCKICWPSFSSASQDRAVAEEFAKGESGTLFFLTSVNAKPISAISRFPEEAEVLFPPNTIFEITSNLLGTSEIGAFYGRVDNIAMSETTGTIAALTGASAPPRIPIVGHTSFMLHVPTELCYRILELLSNAGIKVIETVDADEQREGYAAELLAVTRTITSTEHMEYVDDYTDDSPTITYSDDSVYGYYPKN